LNKVLESVAAHNAGPNEGREISLGGRVMKKKQKLYAGGRKVREGAKQAEAHTGRDQGVAHKARFKQGPFARTDRNAGRAEGPLLPAGQVATPPQKKAGGSTDDE
jgi:hypothetical protein